MRYKFIEIVEEAKVIKEENLGKGCTCDVSYHEAHTCPFNEEINDDYETLCNCCSYCIEQCSYEI